MATPFTRGMKTSPSSLVRIVVASLIVLVGAFAIELATYRHGGHSSLSDLPRVFLHRGFGRGVIPYVDRVVEYPVGAGILLYLAALVAPSPFGVLAVTAVAAAVVGTLIVVTLR